MSTSFQYVFIHFLWILNFSGFERSFFWYGWKKHPFTSPDFCLRTNVFSEKNSKFVSFFALWAKDFHTLEANVPAVFSNLRCTLPEKVFGRKFSWKKTAFNFFLALWATRFQTLSGFSPQALHKIHFSYLKQMSESKIVWKTKSFVFFTVLWGRFSHFRQRCWVSFLTSALKPCRILFSLFSSFFCGFWTCQNLNQVLSVKMAKTQFYQSRFSFEDKCLFEKKL